MHKKICMMTSVHRPFDTRIFVKEASSLAEAGYEVTLIVPHDRDELKCGLQIRAVPKPHTRFERMTRTTWRIFRAASREKFDVYHFHDPELIPAGIALRLMGARVVYDVHEHLPRQIQSKYWLPAPVRGAVGWVSGLVEKVAGYFMSSVVVAWPAIATRFPQRKTILVRNFPVADELVGTDEHIAYSERPPWVVYVGAISEIRCASQMVRAMDLLPRGFSARLKLAGNMSPPSLEEELPRIAGWDSTDYLGWQSRDELVQLLASARMGLLLFQPEPNHLEALPNKLFEYMSVSLPIVASDFPLWREIVEQAGCGILVDPSNLGEIGDAVSYLLSHPERAEEMGRRGRQAIESRFNWASENQKLLTLYRKLAGPDPTLNENLS